MQKGKSATNNAKKIFQNRDAQEQQASARGGVMATISPAQLVQFSASLAKEQQERGEQPAGMASILQVRVASARSPVLLIEMRLNIFAALPSAKTSALPIDPPTPSLKTLQVGPAYKRIFFWVATPARQSPHSSQKLEIRLKFL
jgi:hypothetical protein